MENQSTEWSEQRFRGQSASLVKHLLKHSSVTVYEKKQNKTNRSFQLYFRIEVETCRTGKNEINIPVVLSVGYTDRLIKVCKS